MSKIWKILSSQLETFSTDWLLVFNLLYFSSELFTGFPCVNVIFFCCHNCGCHHTPVSSYHFLTVHVVSGHFSVHYQFAVGFIDTCVDPATSGIYLATNSVIFSALPI